VADRFTDALRAHPADWHMMQRVFVADLRLPSPDTRDGG
jgi:phosphatidylinositol dimannoside acyltransferase